MLEKLEKYWHRNSKSNLRKTYMEQEINGNSTINIRIHVFRNVPALWEKSDVKSDMSGEWRSCPSLQSVGELTNTFSGISLVKRKKATISNFCSIALSWTVVGVSIEKFLSEKPEEVLFDVIWNGRIGFVLTSDIHWNYVNMHA